LIAYYLEWYNLKKTKFSNAIWAILNHGVK